MGDHGCCGGNCHDDKTKQGCCGGQCDGNCSCKQEKETSHDHGECCGGGCGGHGPQVELTAEQIATVNRILGDIDDEDDLDHTKELSDEDIETLKTIFGIVEETEEEQE